MRKLTDDESSVLQDCILTFGEASQYDMFNEEMGEAITELSRYKRGRATSGDVAGEFADAHIMLWQMEMMLDLEHLTDAEITAKINRLKDRIKKYHSNQV